MRFRKPFYCLTLLCLALTACGARDKRPAVLPPDALLVKSYSRDGIKPGHIYIVRPTPTGIDYDPVAYDFYEICWNDARNKTFNNSLTDILQWRGTLDMGRPDAAGTDNTLKNIQELRMEERGSLAAWLKHLQTPGNLCYNHVVKPHLLAGDTVIMPRSIYLSGNAGIVPAAPQQAACVNTKEKAAADTLLQISDCAALTVAASPYSLNVKDASGKAISQTGAVIAVVPSGPGFASGLRPME